MSGKFIDPEIYDKTTLVRNVLIIAIAIMTLILGLLYLQDTNYADPLFSWNGQV